MTDSNSALPGDSPVSEAPNKRAASVGRHRLPPWLEKFWPYWPVMVAAVLGILVAFVTPRSWWFIDDDPADAAADAEVPLLACPMHPHIQSRDPKATCPECGMALEPVRDTEILAPHDQRMIGLETVTVEALPLARHLRLFGRLEINQARLNRLSAYVPGRVEALIANIVGMHVRRGDHVVRLYSPSLFAAQEEFLSNRRAAQSPGPMQSQMQRLVQTARNRLHLLGLTDAQIEMIERDGPQTELVITAPQGGVILERHVADGDYVMEGTTLLTMADLSVLWLMLDVFEADLPLIRQGQRVQIRADAVLGITVTGFVEFVEPLVNPMTRTARVRVTVPNPTLDPAESPMPNAPQARRFSPGMFVTAELHIPLGPDGRGRPGSIRGDYFCPMHPDVRGQTPSDCPKCGMALEHAPLPTTITESSAPSMIRALPARAVLDSGLRTVVYVQTEHTAEGKTFELREVEVGPAAYRADDLGNTRTLYRPILRGLSVGDVVAGNGNFLLDSQAQISGKPSLFFPSGQQQKSAVPADPHAGH